MPHFREGGAGSRELLASGADRGSGGQEKCPWRKDVGGATASGGVGERDEEDIRKEWLEKHADREGKAWVTGGGPIAPKGEREAVLIGNKNQEMCMRQDLLFK